MTSELSYREWQPPADLAPWISCLWEIHGAVSSSANLVHRVIPDGCADVILDFEAARRAGAEATVVGPMISALSLTLAGAYDLCGIRMRPGALFSFLKVEARELRGSSALLNDLTRSLRLETASLAAFDECQRRALVIEALRQHVPHTTPPDRLIAHALSKWSTRGILSAEGMAPTVSRHAADLGLSERALERAFNKHVGYTPVELRRLGRFRACLRLYAAGRNDWAELSNLLGYFDQSHLVRDFKLFTQQSPSKWAHRSATVGLFQDGLINAL